MSLIIEDLRHAYGPKTVLKKINLRVQPGEVVCLLGPSGCGKTTLLRLIAGLEELQHGRILINDQIIANDRKQLLPEQRGTGFLFQEFALFPHLTVLENAMFGLSAVKDKAKRRQRAMEALTRVNMQEFSRVYPHELSGGQQQRVALARALAPDPQIILLDEPFSSLDARLRIAIRDQTLHVLKSSKVATVMVTHDPEEAMFMGDRIVLMHQGDIVQSGSPVELYTHPVNAFVARFFSDVNTIQGEVTSPGRIRTIFGEIPARGLPERTRVSLMFRPDAVQVRQKLGELDQTGQGVLAKVMATRLLPGAMLVHLRLNPLESSSDSLHLHARVPCIFPLTEGDQVQVCVRTEDIHVFPADASPAEPLENHALLAE